MKHTHLKYLLCAATLLITAEQNNAQATDAQSPDNGPAIVMTQINIAKKNVIGHLAGTNENQNIELNGARVKAPEYAESSSLQSKIWFTTQEGKQLKWPFIDFYKSPVASIEPAAGIIAKDPKHYNHYSGRTHPVFKNALPSTFHKQNLEPYYAALNLAPTKRPEPRKLSFVD